MLQHRSWLCFSLLFAAVVALPQALPGKNDNANGEEPRTKTQTRITIKDIHCTDCAKKIARKLYAVKGVRGVRAVVKTNTATVTPEQGKQPSPKALWEAVVEAGFKPVKLVGPAGEFDGPPKE